MEQQQVFSVPAAASAEKYEYYVHIANIPNVYSIADLRFFFSDYVESRKFVMFHYCKRPESIWRGDGISKTYQCLVKVSDEQTQKILITQFHKSMWKRESGELLGQWALLAAVRSDDQAALHQLFEPLEMKPPHAIPNGNVGTPRSVIQEAVRKCAIPVSALRKLGITYTAPIASSTRIRSNSIEDKYLQPVGDDESDSGEEWERHIAVEGDPNLQGDHIDYLQEKGRIYENDMEVTWEKGGSGIVMDTIEATWDKYRGDFIERTSDDLDVVEDIDFTALPRQANPGQQLMRRMGWRHGQGLGSRSDGIRQPVDLAANTNREGLGYRQSRETHKSVQRKQQRRDAQLGESGITITSYAHTQVDEPVHKIGSVYDAVYDQESARFSSKRRRVRDSETDIENQMRHYPNWSVGGKLLDDVNAVGPKSND
eukprot:TRINITY_DN5683_c0_g1_i1.p1 TRINITY_DN5683_c0_g1~~TRINITY_DN5683_c0_g1_i1.p1  ORF type:complete len:439 (+),score=56.37 TRINITY_DN5683_c0_g1_i1:38-1318(+)